MPGVSEADIAGTGQKNVRLYKQIQFEHHSLRITVNIVACHLIVCTQVIYLDRPLDVGERWFRVTKVL